MRSRRPSRFSARSRSRFSRRGPRSWRRSPSRAPRSSTPRWRGWAARSCAGRSVDVEEEIAAAEEAQRKAKHEARKELHKARVEKTQGRRTRQGRGDEGEAPSAQGRRERIAPPTQAAAGACSRTRCRRPWAVSPPATRKARDQRAFLCAQGDSNSHGGQGSRGFPACDHGNSQRDRRAERCDRVAVGAHLVAVAGDREHRGVVQQTVEDRGRRRWCRSKMAPQSAMWRLVVKTIDRARSAPTRRGGNGWRASAGIGR